MGRPQLVTSEPTLEPPTEGREEPVGQPSGWLAVPDNNRDGKIIMAGAAVISLAAVATIAHTTRRLLGEETLLGPRFNNNMPPSLELSLGLYAALISAGFLVFGNHMRKSK